MSAVVPIAVLCVLILGFVPLVMAGAPLAVTSSTPAVTTSTAKTNTTTTDICTNALCQSPNPQNKTFDPSTIPSYFGTDIGKFDVQTAKDGFKWSTGPQDSLTMGIPTVGGSPLANSAVYYNSTHTAYKLAGAFGSLSVFFKQTQYRVKISIHSSFSSPQTVCLPFSSPNPIKQTSNGTSLFASIKSGNEIFGWSDIPLSYSPAWTSISNSLCLSLPIGIVNIDPLALDGSNIQECPFGSYAGGANCNALTLTTANTNDVIIVHVCSRVITDTYSVSDTSTLTWTSRITAGVTNTFCDEFSAIAASALSGDTITVKITSIANDYGETEAFGISGANTASPFDGCNAGAPASSTGTSTTPSTSCTTTNANDFIFGLLGEAFGQAQTVGTGFTKISDGNTAFGSNDPNVGDEYQIVSSTQSGLAVGYTIGGVQPWTMIADAVKQLVTNQPVVLVLAVNPSPSPDGGMILKCPTDICNFAYGYITVSSTSTITVGTTSSVFALIAQQYSGYIWNGWSGATTYVANTVNPIQVLSITSFATTTQSSTLTANFLAAVAPAQSNFAAFTIAGIVVAFSVIALMVAKRR